MNKFMTNNNIKHQDAGDLMMFLEGLPRQDRIIFTNKVIATLKIHRQTFANWKAMCCRIPKEAKLVMEDLAGDWIFKIRS